MDWVTARVCSVPSTIKGCELPGKRVPEKQQEWLNTRQRAGKGWENGANDDSCGISKWQETLPDSAPGGL